MIERSLILNEFAFFTQNLLLDKTFPMNTDDGELNHTAQAIAAEIVLDTSGTRSHDHESAIASQEQATESTLSSSRSERAVLRDNLCKLKLPFPWKLHQLLDDVANDGYEHIISWLPCGKAFRVHNPPVFAREIMMNYFRQTKYSSFTRRKFGMVSNSHVSYKFKQHTYIQLTTFLFVPDAVSQKNFTFTDSPKLKVAKTLVHSFILVL